MLIFLRDWPSLQKLSGFETSNAPSTGATTRQIFNLTHGKGLSETERKRLIQSLCVALETRFEDTTYGVIEATAVANFKMWPLKEEELEGFQPITLYSYCYSPTFV